MLAFGGGMERRAGFKPSCETSVGMTHKEKGMNPYRRARGSVVFVLLSAWFVCGMLAAGARAQTFRGTILGTITDQSGASVAGAKVTIRNLDTGLERETVTADDGSYRVVELPIGNYSMTIEKAGFRLAVISDLKVEVATERRVDEVLQPGEVTQKVEVSGSTLPMVETTSNTLGGTFESKQVLDLPINGRDYTKLLIMVPGAAGEPNGGGDSPGSFGLFSANGNRGRANNFLLDGTDMNDGYRNLPAINQGGVFGTPGTVLPLESIAEVKVLSNFEPEYGRNSGSVVNIVTKSGTNELHGSVYEFFRNTALNARNFFNSAGPKDGFHNNQFGGAMGGPLVKNKTFFYAAYEGQRETVAVTSVNVVPSVADYRAAVTSLGGSAAPCSSTIFGCVTGQVPGVINPVILNLFKFCNTNGHCSGGKDLWPAPNIANALPGAPNSADGDPAFNNVSSFIVKLDHTLNQRNQLTGRYFFGNSNQSFPLGLAGGNNLPGTNTLAPIRTQLVSTSLVTTFSSDKVNEARFGWNRYRNGFFAVDRSVFGNPNASFGLNNGVTDARDFGLPTFRFFTLSFLGSSPFSNPRDRVDSNWQWIDGFSWKSGRHDLKAGYEFHRTAVDSFNDFSRRGVLVFGPGNGFTDLANFLQGTPVSTVLFASRIITGVTDRQARQNSHAFYLQDSAHWTNRLTVNLGVRWDYFGVIHDTQGRFSVYDPAVGLAARDPLYDRDLNNFAPRVSIAWDATGKGKTVVRAGFGVFYDNFSQDAFTGQIYTNSFNAGAAYNAFGPNPVILNKALTQPTLGAGVPVFIPGNHDATSDASTVQRDLSTPYIYNFNLNVQQQLFTNTVLQVGYVGSVGHKLLRIRDINQPTVAAIDAADLACACILDFGAPRNFTTPLSALVPNAPFIINQLESTAGSYYHSLQTSLTQQNWHGFTHQVLYTWSHSIDTASDSQDYVPNAAIPQDSTSRLSAKGPSNFDVRQRFVWSSTYSLPKWDSLGRFGSGWLLSGILTLMSGHPFNLNYNGIDDYSGGGSGFDRPDVVGPIVYNRSDPTQFLNLSAFKIPCSYPAGGGDGFAGTCIPGSRHFGNLGRNALLGPDYRNLDIAISKDTQITERFKLQLRADFYNLPNHPNFANPLAVAFIADAAPNRTLANNTGIDPVTGRSLGKLPITATSDVGLGNPFLGGGGPRSIQFSMRFSF
jgi:hypothetical protein